MDICVAGCGLGLLGARLPKKHWQWWCPKSQDLTQKIGLCYQSLLDKDALMGPLGWDEPEYTES